MKSEVNQDDDSTTHRDATIATGFLQWSECADTLAHFVNSNAGSGSGSNPCATSKVLLTDRVIGISKLERVSDFVSKEACGKLLKIDESVWHVTVANGVVGLSGFLDEYGQKCTARALARQCNLFEGDQLPIITPKQAEWLKVTYAQARHSEHFWSQQLVNYEPCKLSILQNYPTQAPAWTTTAHQSLSLAKANANELLTAWLIYIARDTQISQFQIGWDAIELNQSYQSGNVLATHLFRRTVPFSTCIELNENFSNVLASVKKDSEKLTDHLPCLSKLFARHGTTFANEFQIKNPWPLAVSFLPEQCVTSTGNTGDYISNPYAHGGVLTLQINKYNESFRWIFDKNQISEEEINRISSRLLILISSAREVEQTQKPVGKLNLLPRSEREYLLNISKGNDTIFPVQSYIHQLFEEQVTCNGQTIAVECEGKAVTYEELNCKANRLAHYLIEQGIKPDDRVALCVKRSIKMFIGILGILKSGAAYVPLDPIYSSQRLTNILKDSESLCLLADSNGQKVFEDHQVPVVDLDEALPANLSVENPDPNKLKLTPSHLCYVIYTSGSTGTPKGVMVEHRQVINYLHAKNHACNFCVNDVWCFFNSFSFDSSVSEIGLAWLNGGKLVIVPQEIIYNPTEFYRLICEQGVTVIDQTPAALKAFQTAESESSQRHRLRWIIFGGESTEPISLRRWYKTQDIHSLRMVHAYGPTEASISSTIWIYDITNCENAALPIGRPLSNIRTYLLDSFGELVPLGAEGELYIGGVGVTRGYLNRPELTAERFLPDPFSEDSTARMYRTGDRAQYLPDGNLVYVGRTDEQVKIRGFRIEPGEIEARLVEHPLVRDAVILPWTDNDGSDTKLVAYVVSDPDSALAQKLRTYLASRLPEYMVPAAYVCLSSLPLTPNGKVDRRALPAPDNNAFARQSYEAPHNQKEKLLAEIWSELLHIERISRHDNFFALGGHSLLIVRMLSQLQQFGLNTSVKEVYNTKSLAALAKTLGHHESINIPPNLITEDCTIITPEMLPFINLSQTEIDVLVAQVPGGISNIQDIYGLAPLQHGILFHHMMAKRGDPYLIISHMTFKDRTVLEHYATTLQMVIQRHDILRSIFIWEGLNEPAQIVLRQVPSVLTEVKLNDSDGPVLEQLCKRFDPRHYKLDLKQAPLAARLLASPTSDGSWIALELMHHIVGDHITEELIYSEIQAIIDGKSDCLTTPTPFRHVVAQARVSASQADHTEFFTKMLADVDTPTLPFGLIDVHNDGDEIEEVVLKLSTEFNNQLRWNARQLRVSLASLCHLAWAQVLFRASGNCTVVFGTVLLGRLQFGKEMNSESAIGLLMNTLPLRIDIDETSVKNAVRHTHNRLSALVIHEHATLALAQQCSGVSKGLALFNALLNFRHSSQTESGTKLPNGVDILSYIERSNYPLSLCVDDNDVSVGLVAQVMSPISATRICAYMQQALMSLSDAIACSPKRSMRTLTVIPEEEREILLKHWNNTAVTFPPACCLHELFEMQVVRYGEAIAVECEGQTMTYSELNCEANRLAHYLIEQEVKPDDRIAVCVKRSIKMIIAILGILKSGGAYVPLDPIYSSQRLTNILEESEPLYLLADSIGEKSLGVHKVKTVDLDEILPANLSVNNPDAIKLRLNPAHLAYIIYTSGSTGTPKGVMVEHQQVINLLHAMNQIFEFNDKDVWCPFQSFSFDVFVSEIGGAWYCGGQLVIAPQEIIHCPAEFYRLICKQFVTVLNITPAALKIFQIAESESTQTHSLRWIIFGGESSEPVSLRQWYKTQHNYSLRMCQMYGPTETTISATCWIYDDTIPENAKLPIGRSLSNIWTYILDAFGEPVPLGAEGELYIGGAGVARGYLNRPKLTAKRFLPDPFCEDPMARMYRTGDRARYLSDGNLVFCGRTDQQVKIRGFRIEPGEIEARLIEHSLVRDAVVQTWNDSLTSETRLVAYVIADSDSDSSLANNLRTYLTSLLPNYMVPAAYVCLSSLPLTPNGKIDRRALPAPDDDAFTRQPYEAPQGLIEEKLSAIWNKLLGIERISRHDNFFELGGHSLLVMQFINQTKQLFSDVFIDTRSLFMYPVLKDFAKMILIPKRLYSDVAIPIRPSGNQAPIFILPDGWGEIYYALVIVNEIDKCFPVYALPWSLPEEKQPISIEEMADTMISMIKKVQPNEPYTFIGYSAGGILAYEIANQLMKSGDSAIFLGLIDTYPLNGMSSINETHNFLDSLAEKFPFFTKFEHDRAWWNRVRKLTLTETIEEIKKLNTELTTSYIEWEVMLVKQRGHYVNLCIEYQFNELIPININLFKASECECGGTIEACCKISEFFTWKNRPITIVTHSVPGDHLSIISNPNNRILLGKKVNQILISNIILKKNIT